ncbi:hypothetical protein C8F01DRAFT_1154647 [Mycena amicta]|nr:hypothetical protein C8F01DRAFT_1154647 [Mycena amicta]
MACAAVSASPMWVPAQDGVAASWPPKFSFCPTKTRRTSCSDDDAMNGLGASPRSAAKAIPNRPSRSRSKSLSFNVPSTPTDLWRPVQVSPKPKQCFEVDSAPSERCTHPPVSSGRIRPFSLDQDVCPPSSPRPAARRLPLHTPPPRPPTPEPTEPDDDVSDPGPVLSISAFPTLLLATPAPSSVCSEWVHHEQERSFFRQWREQKRQHPRLPLVVSPLNPLRDAMPSWISSSKSSTGIGPRAQWNIKKPLPLPTALRTRRACDEAGEHCTARQFFSGKLRHHCSVCAKDSLHKRLLLFNYWVDRADAELEDALQLEDIEMVPVDEFPKCVFLRDRDDFDDEAAMEEDPLIIERHPECHSLRLF